jgi:signal transduction histidine kinase
MLFMFVGTLAIATFASVLIAREVLESRLTERSTAELHQEIDELDKMAAATDPETGKPLGGNASRLFTAYFAANAWTDGEAAFSFVEGKPFLISPSYDDAYRHDRDAALLDRWGSVQATLRGSADTPAGRLDFLAVPVNQDGEVSGTFVAGHYRASDMGAVRGAYAAVIGVGLVVLLVGSLLAWHMANQVLRPVSEITTGARSISESDLTRRIEVHGRDEIAALAETFNAMLDRLQRAFGSQRQFLDDAGHELRTPITIIRGHLELLEDDPEQRRETLDLVLDELDRMSRMVNELILLAKAERPDFLRRAPVDVASLTDELLTKAAALGERDWVLDGKGEGTILVDRQRLTQAMMQLAQNAEAHTERGQQIGIGSELDSHSARLWVRDMGCGVAPEDQVEIFDRFERRRPESRDGGVGLGLSIVRAITEAHGGRVVLQSELGKGATFLLDLPLDGASNVRMAG